MKIAVGADPLGFDLKNKVKKHLLDSGYEVLDVGTVEAGTPVPYIEASDNVCQAVLGGKAERGIVFCGTGMGVSIVANKNKGIYCACVESAWAAHESRVINDANVLALGGRILGEGMADDIVDVFLRTSWCEKASEQRKLTLGGLLEKVHALEDAHFK